MYAKKPLVMALATFLGAASVGTFAATRTVGVDVAATGAAAAIVLAREASEPPRGRDNERPGDRQRGRFQEEQQLAREASEPPRGRDNERAGDRQRGRAHDDTMQLVREASEGPRGRDNERAGDRGRRNHDDDRLVRRGADDRPGDVRREDRRQDRREDRREDRRAS